MLTQINNYYDAKQYELPQSNYKIGDDVKLKKGTLLHGTYKNLTGLKEILKEHKAIYLAFEAKNAVTARKVMEEHIRHSKARRMIDYEFPDNKR